jgi:hypothetical protein
MKTLLALFALICSVALAQTTVTIPAQTVTVKIPAQTITIPAQSGTTTPPVITPPVVTPPAAGVAWVFHNGTTTSLFGGDYSYGSGSISYTTKDPDTGETVVGVTGDEAWQPYFRGNDFDTTGYHFVLVSIKPTIAGQQWGAGAESVGDVPVPGSTPGVKNFMQYCTAFVIGQWMTCKIPFSLYTLDKNPGLHVYKFGFQEQGPAPAGKLNWLVKDYGISP